MSALHFHWMRALRLVPLLPIRVGRLRARHDDGADRRALLAESEVCAASFLIAIAQARAGRRFLHCLPS